MLDPEEQSSPMTQGIDSNVGDDTEQPTSQDADIPGRRHPRTPTSQDDTTPDPDDRPPRRQFDLWVGEWDVFRPDGERAEPSRST